MTLFQFSLEKRVKVFVNVCSFLVVNFLEPVNSYMVMLRRVGAIRWNGIGSYFVPFKASSLIIN